MNIFQYLQQDPAKEKALITHTIAPQGRIRQLSLLERAVHELLLQADARRAAFYAALEQRHEVTGINARSL